MIRGGGYEWNIGRAGSAVMLALAVLPLGLFADRPCLFRITGGLFQDFAPLGLPRERPKRNGPAVDSNRRFI